MKTYYVLTTEAGWIYRGPDWMPFAWGSRASVKRIAAKYELADWKPQPVSRTELADIHRACQRHLGPIAFTEDSGVKAL